MQTLIRVEGLDDMLLVPFGPEAVVRNLFRILPKHYSPSELQSVTVKALRRIWNVEPVDYLPFSADFLIRIDKDKVLIRSTNQEYSAAPSWGSKVAPLEEVIPTPGSPVRAWKKGDPSLRSLKALACHLEANGGLGEAFRSNLLNLVSTAR